jgi:hypothetical protein
VKIIHRGEDPATQPVLAQCSRCGTQIEFMPSEAQFVSDQRDGDFYRIGCPICNHEITANAQRYNGPG